LANKESLVAGGPLVSALAAPGQIIPVDSEHSALAQCLRAGSPAQVRRLLLTASGGPFRGWSAGKLDAVTPAQALAHPTWSMGPVVTINSATLMNKGLEVIEAHVLFNVPYERIDVVVHPQSVVHSMVEFVDGSVLAQAAQPDMHLPIALALSWPERVPQAVPALDWTRAHTWRFEPLDELTFPAVSLARRAGVLGGMAPAVLNAANEVCVDAFLAGNLPFPAIVATVGAVLAAYEEQTAVAPWPDGQPRPPEGGILDRKDQQLTLAAVASAESWARDEARRRCERAWQPASILGAHKRGEW
jgi:1-deoxy-D-xylulose-5-phosphate reductoisomerase